MMMGNYIVSLCHCFACLCERFVQMMDLVIRKDFFQHVLKSEVSRHHSEHHYAKNGGHAVIFVQKFGRVIQIPLPRSKKIY